MCMCMYPKLIQDWRTYLGMEDISIEFLSKWNCCWD
jgi:hypothetical protein